MLWEFHGQSLADDEPRATAPCTPLSWGTSLRARTSSILGTERSVVAEGAHRSRATLSPGMVHGSYAPGPRRDHLEIADSSTKHDA